MKWKKGLAILAVITTFMAFCVGCKNDTEEPSENPPSIETGTSGVSFEKAEYTVLLGEETYLLATYEPSMEKVVEYSSSNPTVATVDGNGKVLAVGLGEAVLTVKYGEDTAECKVTVIQGESVPSLYFACGWGDEVSVESNSLLDFSTYVLFNGKTYNDQTVSYTFDDDTIGEVVNGTFTPKKVGTCTVDITAVWRGIESILLEKTITVNVVSDVELFVNDGATNYVMHNKAQVGTETYEDHEIDFVVTALENGQATSFNVEVVEGTDIVRYENGKLTVLNERVGEAQLLVSCQDTLGNTFAVRVFVAVYLSAPPDSGYFKPEWING